MQLNQGTDIGFVLKLALWIVDVSLDLESNLGREVEFVHPVSSNPQTAKADPET